MHTLYNEDCLIGALKIPDGSVKLGIYDPPFGINESSFDKHYKRDAAHVIEGYQEAPQDQDYGEWTLKWMMEAQRILANDGSMFVIMGHTNLRHVLNAAAKLKLIEVNHLIWKFNFGVNTTKKFVTSHYHVLYYSKTKHRVFNTYCRFGAQERDEENSSALYRDLEDVFYIHKEYSPGEEKNENKLPTELIKKLILYTTNEGDLVCDFFMGNFTTAYAALGLNRQVIGFEINKNSYDHHLDKIGKYEVGCLKDTKPVINVRPENQGKSITEEEEQKIYADYTDWLKSDMLIKDIKAKLQEKYGRGPFSITNIIGKKRKQPQ